MWYILSEKVSFTIFFYNTGIKNTTLHVILHMMTHTLKV